MISHEAARAILKEYLVEAGYRSASIATRLAYAAHLFSFLQRQGIEDLRSVERKHMVAFAGAVNEAYSVKREKPLLPRSKLAIWSTARLIFRALYERSLILAHPMRTLTFAPSGKKAVRIPLSESEVARFLDGIDEDAPCGRRDRALFELIYSSGLRAGETSSLVVGDVDLEHRLVKVRQGKFARDRVVPMTMLAASLLSDLMRFRVPSDVLFRGPGGKKLCAAAINRRYKKLLERLSLDREGLSVHALRHACATHLIEHGADIRYVQALLGHESVETTVLYTRDRVDNLRRRYLRCHPRENDYRKTVDEAYRAAFEALLERLAATQAIRARRGLKNVAK